MLIVAAYITVPKVLLIAFKNKEQAGDVTASTEPNVPPPALKERFEQLLQDAASAVRSGRVAVQVSLPGRSGGPAAASNPDSEALEPVEVPLTVENVGVVEGIFDTSVGANVENEQLCRFLRGTTTAY